MSDEKGAYRIENLSPGRYRCIVSAQGYLPKSDRLPESSPGGTLAFDIHLSKGVTITGRVVDSATGKPLADVEIISMTGRGDMAVLAGGPVKTRSGPDGKFTLDGVKIQEKVHWSREGGRKVEKTMAVLMAFKAGWEQENREFETTPGNDLPGVELRMHGMPQATGTVVGPDGKPIANAEVVVIAGGNPENWDVMILTGRKVESIRTDASGRFTAFLPGGKKAFIALLHPAFAYKIVQYTDVAAGSRPDPITVKLGPGGTVEGTVLDPHGNPLPGIPVALQPKGNSKQDLRSVMHHPLMQKYLPKIRSDAKGRFTIPHLPSGKWRLVVQPEQGGASFEEIVDVTQGRTVQTTIRTQPLLTIEGMIVDQGGKALSGVQVWASMEKGTGHANDETGSDGTFKLVGLAAGRYTVSLWHPDYPYARMPGIEAGAMGLRLVLKTPEEEKEEEDE
jgi:protocatechuate 3,4-dioxygenase beta subunit